MKSPIAYWLPKFAMTVAIALPTTSRAEMTVNFEIGVYNRGGVTTYSGVPEPFSFPSGPNAPFITGLIASQDQQYVEYTVGENQWSGSTNPTFTSFNDLIASLMQPWTITLDKGLATERNYTMMLNLGGALTTDLTPLVVTYPLDGALLNSLTPTFQFSASSQFLFHADLGNHSHRGE